ncbi:MAG TPA: hypothetical protein VEU47_12420 [Candidatus Cybelea sp.]|nr:hypothetical protein [Candidatus Cybelea sp.]
MTRKRFLIALAVLLAVAACGKKGRLEPPEGSDPRKSDVDLPDIRTAH